MKQTLRAASLQPWWLSVVSYAPSGPEGWTSGPCARSHPSCKLRPKSGSGGSLLGEDPRGAGGRHNERLEPHPAAARSKTRARRRSAGGLAGRRRGLCRTRRRAAPRRKSPRGTKTVLEPLVKELEALGEPYRWLDRDALAEEIGTAYHHAAVYMPGCVPMNQAALTRGTVSGLLAADLASARQSDDRRPGGPGQTRQAAAAAVPRHRRGGPPRLGTLVQPGGAVTADVGTVRQMRVGASAARRSRVGPILRAKEQDRYGDGRG